MNTTAELAKSTEAPRFSVPRLLRSIFIDGARFWERGRLAYNGVQLLLTGVMVLICWPQSRNLFIAPNLGTYLSLAIAANVLFCAAYFVETILQIPQLRQHARPIRWFFLISGTIVACLLAGIALQFPLFSDPRAD